MVIIISHNIWITLVLLIKLVKLFKLAKQIKYLVVVTRIMIARIIK